MLREIAVVARLRKRIERLIDSEGSEILHAHSPALCGLAAWLAARSRRIPLVYEVRSFWEDSAVWQKKTAHASLRYRLSRKLESFVVRHADAVVGIARSIVTELEHRGVPAEKLFLVPNGVDVARFSPRPRDATLALQLRVDGVPTLGYLGTLFPWEGIPWLVFAASELHRRGAEFKLLIVGDGVEAAEVRKAIQATGTEGYISYVGRVPNDQVERYYSVLDVLVYPRRAGRTSEMVTPLKPLEAMALGKPVLGSAVGGIRELIEPEVTGILFEPENIEDFCRQASRLLADADLRRTLGGEARRKTAEERDWRVLAQRYRGVYEAAIRNARSRA
jgi:glycogen(starch) synthase